MKPLCIDLFCGLGGWAEGFLAEGYDVVGFDLERHDYGSGGYPGQLVIQDVLTLHGSQFRNAAVIVASPPCTEYSYMAMPWSRGKQIAGALREEVPFPDGYTGSRTVKELRALFDACFRIAKEAGVPLVVENVKGAQPWVGRARAHFGSFYLWGDVNSVGNRIVAGRPKFGEGLKPARAQKRNPDGTEHPQGSWFKIADSKERGSKNGGGSWFAIGSPGQVEVGQNPDGRKQPEGNCSPPMWKDREIARLSHATPEEYAKYGFEDGRKVAMNFHEHEKTGKPGRSFQSAAVEGLKVPVYSDRESELIKFAAERYPDELSESLANAGKDFVTGLGKEHDWRQDPSGRFNSKSDSRKAASAQIAKIPFPLAQWIAKTFKP